MQPLSTAVDIPNGEIGSGALNAGAAERQGRNTELVCWMPVVVVTSTVRRAVRGGESQQQWLLRRLQQDTAITSPSIVATITDVGVTVAVSV